jgi:transcriptional repressor NrdR
VSADEIERIVARIVSEVAENHDREVSSREIGDLVMRELRAVNEVAYVRFASVYREFRDVTEFRRLLEEFVKGAERDGEVSGEVLAGDLPASPAAEPPPRRTGATKHPEGGKRAGDRKG